MVGIAEEEHLATFCAAEKCLGAIRQPNRLADPWPDRTDVTTQPALHATRQQSETFGGKPDVGLPRSIYMTGLRASWTSPGLCAFGILLQPVGGLHSLIF